MGAPFLPRAEDLPNPLPVFPLAGALLLPRGRLPLNIFEPRYLALVGDCLGQGRMFGMIQPRDSETVPPPLYDVGCVGRISSFAETPDGRFLITLTGVTRFRVAGEVEMCHGYRRLVPDYAPFLADLSAEPDAGAVDRTRLKAALRPYFERYALELDWKAIEVAGDEALITALAMLCPLAPREKQALLESPGLTMRAEILTALLEMAMLEGPGGVPGPAGRQ